MRQGLLLVIVCGCGSSDGKQSDASVGDPLHDAAAVDGTPRPCSLTKPFDTPVLVGGVNSNSTDMSAWQSADGRTLYFTSAATSSSNYDIYYATRAQPSGPFSSAMQLGGVNTTTNAEQRPVITADGLTMYAQSDAQGMPRIYVATRMSTSDDFGPLGAVTEVNTTTASDLDPWISGDGRTLYMTSTRGGTSDLYRSTRANASTPFTTPAPVSELNTAAVEYAPVVSDDGLEIYFASTQGSTGTPPSNIWHAKRSTTNAAFGMATKVEELSASSTEEFPSWLSADRCTLIFTSDRSGGNGGYDIWTATRPL